MLPPLLHQLVDIDLAILGLCLGLLEFLHKLKLLDVSYKENSYNALTKNE
jgi:hypothetical protein